MKPSRVVAAIAALSLLIATGCGGGGETASTSPPTTPPSGEINTYGSTNLPGRLLVNDPAGKTTLFDLRTGLRTTLPKILTANTSDRWTAGASTSTILRWQTHADREGPIPISFFNTSTWATTRADLPLWATFQRPKLSADGKYILAFWHDGSQGVFSDEKNPLTIFDITTGAAIKRGSQLPENETVTSTPAAWLPDGRYAYLAAEKLYISSPSSSGSTLVASLALPSNSVFNDGSYVSGNSQLVASPDGRQLAFTWTEYRGTARDGHIWGVNIDGTGLRRLTEVPDLSTAGSFGYGSPTWSPDSRWVAGVLYMDGSVVAPIFPPDQSFPGVPGGVIGSTGCATNPIFVLPATANKVAVSWPTYDAAHGVKVLNSAGTGGQWLSTCGGIEWLQ